MDAGASDGDDAAFLSAEQAQLGMAVLAGLRDAGAVSDQHATLIERGLQSSNDDVVAKALAFLRHRVVKAKAAAAVPVLPEGRSLSRMPNLVLQHAIPFLEDREVCSLAETCKKAKFMCFKEEVWRAKLLQVAPESEPHLHALDSFRTLYFIQGGRNMLRAVRLTDLTRRIHLPTSARDFFLLQLRVHWASPDVVGHGTGQPMHLRRDKLRLSADGKSLILTFEAKKSPVWFTGHLHGGNFLMSTLQLEAVNPLRAGDPSSTVAAGSVTRQFLSTEDRRAGGDPFRAWLDPLGVFRARMSLPSHATARMVGSALHGDEDYYVRGAAQTYTTSHRSERQGSLTGRGGGRSTTGIVTLNTAVEVLAVEAKVRLEVLFEAAFGAAITEAVREELTLPPEVARGMMGALGAGGPGPLPPGRVLPVDPEMEARLPEHDVAMAALAQRVADGRGIGEPEQLAVLARGMGIEPDDLPDAMVAMLHEVNAGGDAGALRAMAVGEALRGAIGGGGPALAPVMAALARRLERAGEGGGAAGDEVVGPDVAGADVDGADVVDRQSDEEDGGADDVAGEDDDGADAAGTM